MGQSHRTRGRERSQLSSRIRMKFALVLATLLCLCYLGELKQFYSGKFEGDIAVRGVQGGGSGGSPSDAFVGHQKRKWDSNVPFYVDKTSIRSEKARKLIHEVIEGIHEAATCITFEDISEKDEKTGDHIRITAHGDSKYSGTGCWSYVGKQGGEQVINLGEGCLEWSTIEHQLLHALGQVHEHTRPDRDDHVVINPDNIQPGKEHNFVKRSRGQGSEDVAGVEGSYDLYSLLHYPGTAWSKDQRSETITPVNKLYVQVGSTGGMTMTDMVELNLNYLCPEISSLVLVRYVHEVEHRLAMERKDMESKFEERFKNLEEKLKLEDLDPSASWLLYSGGDGQKYYRVPVANGVTLLEGAVVATCPAHGLVPVCIGQAGSGHNSAQCRVPALPGSGWNSIDRMSRLICNGKIDKECPQTWDMFMYMHNYSGSEHGYVESVGGWVEGKDYVSTTEHPYYAFCVL